MRLEEIQTIAKSHGIKPAKRSKMELIKYIQTNEGNFDCFATASDGVCDQLSCRWRGDCLDVAQQGELS